jgi:hypothetical protein
VVVEAGEMVQVQAELAVEVELLLLILSVVALPLLQTQEAVLETEQPIMAVRDS